MKNSFQIYLFTLVLMLIIIGCDTEELHDLNKNPEAVTEIDLNFLFSTAELSVASNGGSANNRFTDWTININFCAQAIQQITLMGTNVQSSSGNFYIHKR